MDPQQQASPRPEFHRGELIEQSLREQRRHSGIEANGIQV